MILPSHPQSEASPDLCNYIEKEIGISKKAIDLGLRQSKLENTPLPIILFSFGLINISQFEQIIDWQYKMP